MLKRALVTGATGYLGSELVKTLVTQGVTVSIIVRPSSDLALLAEVLPQLQVFVDQNHHPAMVEFIKSHSPEVVFHLASLFLVEHQPEQVSHLIEANIGFSTRLCEAMLAAGVKRLVNTGTSWQHYEQAVYKPVNLYAATKQAFYDILAYYSDAHAFQVINLELFDTYGPHDPRRKLLQILLRQINQSEPLAMSRGEQELNLVHVEDIVRGYVQATVLLESIEHSCCHTYFLNADETITVRELVSSVERIAKPRCLKVQLGGRPYRHREVMQLWSQGVRLPGWSPKISLEAGLQRLLVNGV